MFAPGPGETPSPDNQVHDFNPGISSNGLFWTTALPFGSVAAHPGAGTASMNVTDQEMPDYHDLINALFGGTPPVPGVVSYEVNWSEPSERANVKNTDSGFAGLFARGSATIEWSGCSGDFEFVSDPAATSVSLVAEVGHERNGVFFD